MNSPGGTAPGQQTSGPSSPVRSAATTPEPDRPLGARCDPRPPSPVGDGRSTTRCKAAAAPKGSARGRAAPPHRPFALLGHALVGIQALDALVIHGPAFAAEEHVEVPIAVRHARLCQVPQALPQRLLRRRHARVPHARTGDAARVTCGALGDRIRLLHPAHPRPLLRWAYHFFAGSAARSSYRDSDRRRVA